ncbi:MAG: hypothetical protein ACRD8W_05630 [Nitrososphaeraceae archaeon]
MTLIKTAERTLARSKRLLNEINTEKAAALIATVAPEFVRMGEQRFNREVETLSNLMNQGTLKNDYDLGEYLEYLTYKANPTRAQAIQSKRRQLRQRANLG